MSLRGAILTLALVVPLHAQAEATRALTLDGRLLNLPVCHGAPKQLVKLEVGGKQVREFEIEFAPEREPDLWVFLEVTAWRGRQAALRGSAAMIAVIASGDAVKTSVPVYAEASRPQWHFTSPDLKHWTDESRVVGFYECPDLFPMKVEGTGETRWIVHGGSGEYLVGDFDGHKFTPRSGPLHGTYGGAYYAGQNFSDMPDGRVVQMGWAKMTDAPFAGMPFGQMMNLPVELTLKQTKDGPKLAWAPVREIETLRSKAHRIAPAPLNEKSAPLKEVSTEFFDLRADIEAGSAGEIVLSLRGIPFVIKVAKQTLTSGKQTMPMPVKDGRLKFRLLCDRALVEIFSGDGMKFGAFPLVPKPGAPITPELTARGGTAKILSLEVDELSSVWPVAR
jgi:fructan beta-fructosidase